MSINELIWFMPVFFIIHEFEEMICTKSWTDCQGRKYKKVSENIIPASLLSRAICIKFIGFLACISIASVLQNYIIDLILFSFYIVHLIFHIISTVKDRILVPGIFTALFNIPLCAYILYSILDTLDYNLFTILTSVIISSIIPFINLSGILIITTLLSKSQKKVTTILHNK